MVLNGLQAIAQCIDDMSGRHSGEEHSVTVQRDKHLTFASAISGRADLRDISLEEWEAHKRLYEFIVCMHLYVLGAALPDICYIYYVLKATPQSDS